MEVTLEFQHPREQLCGSKKRSDAKINKIKKGKQ